MESTSFTNSARGMRPIGFAEHKSPAASPYFQKRRLRCGSNSQYFPIKSTFWCSLTSTGHAWEGSLSSVGRGKSQETLHTGRFHQSLQLTCQFQCPFKNLLMHQCSVGEKKNLLAKSVTLPIQKPFFPSRLRFRILILLRLQSVQPQKATLANKWKSS